MKTLSILFVLGSFSTNLGTFCAEDVPAKSLHELQQERLKAATQLVELYRSMEQNAQITPEQMRQALLAMFEAKLDLARGKEARLKVFAESIKELEQLEAFLNARYKIGYVGSDEILRFKVGRLELEVRMAKERAAPPTGTMLLKTEVER